jgi:hypothetical protein
MQLPDFGMIGSGIASFGAASGDMITGEGYYRAAQGYTKAGNIEHKNMELAQASGDIQLAQQRRELYKSTSSTTAAAGGAGLAMSGSMEDVLRSSMAQGALKAGLIGTQTQINVNDYASKSQAYYAESDQATGQGNAQMSKSGSDTLGGIVSMVGAAAMMFI